MLVLSRKVNESIVIDGQIRVTLLMIRGNQVRVGIAAPGRIAVVREELLGTDRTPIRAAAASPRTPVRRRGAPGRRARRPAGGTGTAGAAGRVSR